MQGKLATDRPDYAFAKFDQAAAIFPLNRHFRELSGYYAIYAQAHGLISSETALRYVGNAMDENENSVYLALHYREIRGSP